MRAVELVHPCIIALRKLMRAAPPLSIPHASTTNGSANTRTSANAGNQLRSNGGGDNSFATGDSPGAFGSTVSQLALALLQVLEVQQHQHQHQHHNQPQSLPSVFAHAETLPFVALSWPDELGRTLLTYACAAGYVDVALAMIKHVPNAMVRR